MNGGHGHNFLIFLFIIFIILARPVVVFSAPVLQQLLSYELKTCGCTKAIRKRKETIYTHEEFTLTEERQQPIGILPLRYLLRGLKNWHQQLLQFLSFLVAYRLAFSKNILPLAELVPQRSRHKEVSLFLI